MFIAPVVGAVRSAIPNAGACGQVTERFARHRAACAVSGAETRRRDVVRKVRRAAEPRAQRCRSLCPELGRPVSFMAQQAPNWALFVPWQKLLSLCDVPLPPIVGLVPLLLPLEELVMATTSAVTSAAITTTAAIAARSQCPDTDLRTDVVSVLMVPSPGGAGSVPA
jgi:hypothetical protein